MFAWYPIQDPQRNLPHRASRLRWISWPFAPVSAIPRINSTQKHQNDSYDTLCSINTGVPWKWFRPVLRSPLHAISRGKSSGTGVSHSKNSHSAMPILLEILRLISEKPDCRTLEIDKTVSRWITAIQTTENLLVYGKSGNRLLLEPVEKPTIGLSLTA